MPRDRLHILRAGCLAWTVVASLGAQTTPVSRTLSATYPADSFVVPLNGAGFVFLGTVMQHLPAPARYASQTPHATRVRVDSVLRTPRSVGNLRGKNLTILVRDTVSLVRTRPATFIAAGVSFSDQILLRSHGHVPLSTLGQWASMKLIITAADSLHRALSVRRHVQSADFRFLGTVQTISDSAPVDSQFRHRGEHNPLWREARVRVDAAYGQAQHPAGSLVRVLFPGSADAAYLYSPRLQLDMQAVFIASRANRLLRDSSASVTAGMYFVVRPLDVLPARDSALVRQAVPVP